MSSWSHRMSNPGIFQDCFLAPWTQARTWNGILCWLLSLMLLNFQAAVLTDTHSWLVGKAASSPCSNQVHRKCFCLRSVVHSPLDPNCLWVNFWKTTFVYSAFWQLLLISQPHSRPLPCSNPPHYILFNFTFTYSYCGSSKALPKRMESESPLIFC